ncbi:hypothetical protein HC031_13555 [Planosporangium thailandense]|uniref:Lantibiotic dehydratase N-terminal domain-containing protein n=1 Tax=Planosporangium thailandense TaxID=765197 RepID=A0ABX0XZW2_9ACTN|nr:lantibiotic dehydratase [Planosporangium thailandense]NJC70733.1 hypothetical protein [Planosporangium thailandense]
MTGWRMLSVVVLRQAGFGFDLLSPYAEPDLAARAEELFAAEARLWALVAQLKEAFRQARLVDREAVSSGLGHLRPFPAPVLESLAARLPSAAGTALRAYQDGSVRLAAAWQDWEDGHRDRLLRAGGALREQFRADPLLRDALLLSNEANYPVFARWLDEDGPVSGPRGRKMTDLLARYLQRLAAKNETHSHFGPLNVGRVDRGVAGVAWRPAPLRRRAFLAHWAAEKLAGALGTDPGLADRVRPRRRPWAFERDGVVRRYVFTSEDGYSADWEFAETAPVSLSPSQAALFRHCDGDTTMARLREELGDGVGADLARLVAEDLVVARFEVPVGVADPLPALREQAGPVAPVEQIGRALAAVPAAELPRREAATAALARTFAEVTGAAAHRGNGLHYADRSVFYEECHGPVGDLRIGTAVADLVESELSPVYALALAVPRMRVSRESELLARWMAERFGPGAPVPLDRFYAAYFADRPVLLDACDKIDAELVGFDGELTSMLLEDADPAAAEVRVPLERLAAFLRRCPGGPPAVVNPDVMLAARDLDALARGDFSAVVGDCHATRELLSHSSFSPLIAEEQPAFHAEVTAAYRDLVGPGEVLCDLARSHPDKTATRMGLDLPDVEIYGRSGLPRERVIQPSSLYVLLGDDGRVALHAPGLAGPLRLLAPPSGGPSLRLDPLAPLAFPRRLGGLLLEAGHLDHVPRIRTGRVVLQRQLWRVPVTELTGRGPGGARRKGNAAEFYAAARLRRARRLPRHVFAKFDSEPKPLYVDFASPVLVRQLFRLAHSANGKVTFSEMLPDPDNLWLHRNGQRFTTEIRCAVFSSRADVSRELA